jgi:3'-phosphoadenosine 5'-phosphosulfate sulfotransferase (PAPS reductase)/FAD synthetase
MNKREPFERAKRELQFRCWMTGIRREQSFTRREAKIVLRDYDGLVKVCRSRPGRPETFMSI